MALHCLIQSVLLTLQKHPLADVNEASDVSQDCGRALTAHCKHLDEIAECFSFPHS